MSTTLRDAAENATAGAPVVPERIWITVNGKRSTYPGGGWYLIGGWEANDWKSNSIPYVPASALDTARAEIERLRHEVESAGSLRLRMEAHRQSAIAAESALTAAQERIAELEGALNKVRPMLVLRASRVGYVPPEVEDALDALDTALATLSPAVKEPPNA